MKKKRLIYMDEVKPSKFYYIMKRFLFARYRTSINEEYKEKKELNILAKNIKETSINNGEKYKGKIVKSEIFTNMTSGIQDCRLKSTIYEYYAIVEFTNDKGDIIRFKTDRLSDNPEYLTSKDVSVYVFNNAYYATDFGYIEKPTKKLSDTISDSFKMDK